MRNQLLTALTLVALASNPLLAADKYWDINGATAGASAGATATGTWDTATTANWSTDSTGGSATTTWAASDTAIFAAGTNATGGYTVTATGTPVAAGITIEEGTITLSGRVDVNTGTVELQSGTQLITANSGGATGTGITLTAGGKYAITGNATLRTTNAGSGGSFISSVGTIALSNNANLTVDYQVANSLSIIQTASVISGTGSLTKTGAGVIALAAPSTYSGTTTINGGELRMRTGANRLPTGTAVTVNGTGILNLNDQDQTIASLAGTGTVGLAARTLTINGSASTTFDGALKNIANAGAGAVTTGNGRLVKSGAGTITFNGLNDINGSVTLSAGGITVGASGSLCGDIADLAVNGGVLTLNQAAETVENLTGSGGSIVLNNASLSLVVDPVATSTNSSVISGSGGLTKVNVNSGATVRTEVLAGNNTYDGNTFVKGGILSVQHANALGSTTGYTEVNQVGAVAAELLFTTAAGSVTTSEPLRISGAGATNGGAISVISSATPTISGPVTLIGNSTLAVSSSASVLYNNPNAITSLANQNLTLQGGAGTAPLGIGTISGAIALGTGSLTKLQGGTWVLSNAAGNSYSGGTLISGTTTAGTLSVTNTSGSGTGSGNITIGSVANIGILNVGTGGAGGSVSGDIAFVNTSNTSAVNFNRSTDLTYNGVISGSNGNVTKTGAGILTLGGASSYTGTTTINGGNLRANNTTGSATGTGAVTVNLDGTLSGTGSVAGTVTVNTGGHLAPGASVESLDVGTLSLLANSQLDYEIDSSVSLTAGADLLNVTGNVTIDADAAVNFSDIAATDVHIDQGKFTLMAYTGTLTGEFAGKPENAVVQIGATEFFIRYHDTEGGSNFNGGLANASYVTLTAVPEASVFVFGCVVCAVFGVGYAKRKRAMKLASSDC